MRNLACELIAHERIVTTVAKAKEVRPFVERLITLAKRNTLHARRLIIARLGGKKEVVIHDRKNPDKDRTVRVVVKLFDELAPRYADRPGGYTRIVKRSRRRLGDAGQTAFIELLAEGETKTEKPTRPVAPAVVEQPETPAEQAAEEKASPTESTAATESESGAEPAEASEPEKTEEDKTDSGKAE